MKIAVLTDWESVGGANIAAARMMEGFAAAGHKVTRIFQQCSTPLDPRFQTRLIRSAFSTHERTKASRIAWTMLPGQLQRRVHERASEAQLHDVLREVQPDVINVHLLHIGRWSLEMLRVCSAHAPVVCKLCDTWTFTGRCCFPGDCQKYLTQCDETCPTADEYPALAPRLIRHAFDQRRNILETCSNVAAIAPTTWIGQLAAAGLWKHRTIFRVPNGLNLETYRPLETDFARKALGLDPRTPTLLCSASDLRDRRKGFQIFIDALRAGLRGRLQVVLVGTSPDVPIIPGVTIRSFGFVTDDRFRSIIYNAADLFVHPALEDNSPNTVIESLACGTPVVAFPIRGLPEMVRPGKTGWLANDLSAASLNQTLSLAIESIGTSGELRLSSRRFAETEYEMATAVRRYERVFDLMRGADSLPAGLKDVA